MLQPPATATAISWIQNTIVYPARLQVDITVIQLAALARRPSTISALSFGTPASVVIRKAVSAAGGHCGKPGWPRQRGDRQHATQRSLRLLSSSSRSKLLLLSMQVDIAVSPGGHASEAAVNKQLNDKERVAAALENPNLAGMVDRCLAGTASPM